MSIYLGYMLAFLLIGLFAGYASRADLPGGLANYVAAVAGALAGGIFWLALRAYGWAMVEGGTRAGQGPEAARYAHLAGDTTQPGYWIGIFFAGAGAMLAIALYSLFFGDDHAHS